MSVKVLLEFQAQADQVDAAKEFLREVLPETRAYDGFESLTMHQSDDDPTKFLFWEQWVSRQHYETYLAWRIETGALKQFVDMLTDEPTIRVFNHVGV
jgi:quinol monooxygenase YgiN